ncbi:MAG: DUF4382 domain-containing protein [Fulvivirga sp.]
MKLIKMWSAVLLSMIIFTACNEDDDDQMTTATGKANIYITDAPIDDADVSAVVISISKVEAKGPDGWETIEEFEEPVSLDLLSYQNGDAFFLGDEEVTAGTYSEVRLILNIQEEIEGESAEAASYIEFVDGSTAALFVPSGGQSGYKAKGDFTIPEDGEINMTLDFDVRKAVVQAGSSGKYILKPTIRLVENEKTGTIEGTFEGADTYNKLVVFAYADGEFEETETVEPAEGEVRFSNAITSSEVADNAFTLAFINSGTYDLYFAAFDENGEFVELIGAHEDVSVEAGANVSIELNVDLLN